MNLLIPWLGVGLVFVINRTFPSSFMTLFLVNIWFFSMPHTFSTFLRTDRRNMRSVMWTVLIFILFLFSITSLVNLKGMIILYAIYFFWQQFHYAKQNYGIGAERGMLDQIFYLGSAFIGVMAIFSDGPQSFFGYMLSNPLPFALSSLFLISLNAFLACVYLLMRPAGRYHAVSHVLIFTLAYSVSEHFAEGWLYLNIFHNLQYLKFMHAYEKKFSFFVMPVVLSAVFYFLQKYNVSVALSVISMMALNFTHYTFDALIWKSGRGRQAALAR